MGAVINFPIFIPLRKGWLGDLKWAAGFFGVPCVMIAEQLMPSPFELASTRGDAELGNQPQHLPWLGSLPGRAARQGSRIISTTAADQLNPAPTPASRHRWPGSSFPLSARWPKPAIWSPAPR
jgi:hypothetical protein